MPYLGVVWPNILAMICTIRHEILAKIEDRASFIEYLIEEYPRLLAEWTEKTDMEFQKEAKVEADGDAEVYASTYGSFLSAFDENERREDLFYKAMLLVTYSFYEGAIVYLGENNQTGDPIDAICRANHFELSDKAKDAKSSIQSGIRIIRNQLTHNNMRTKGHDEDLDRISKQWPEILFSDDEITITGDSFILDSLKKELLVLKELCEKLGYKHIRIGQYKSDKTD